MNNCKVKMITGKMENSSLLSKTVALMTAEGGHPLTSVERDEEDVFDEGARLHLVQYEGTDVLEGV